MLSWHYSKARMAEVEIRLKDSDNFLREIADVVLELRANTENLEDILRKIKDEDDADI